MAEKKKVKFIGLDFNKKKDRQKAVFGGLFFLLLFIFLFFFSGTYGILELVKLKRENTRLTLEKDSIVNERALVADSIKMATNDTAFLEKIAREKLGLTKKGEKVFYFIPTAKKK